MPGEDEALPAPPQIHNGIIEDPLITKRRTAAVKLYLEGCTYEKIAERLGYSSRQAALQAVNAKLSQMVEEDVAEFRRRELQHLQELREALRTRTELGDPQAVLAALRVSERIARMLGLDRPAKVDIHSTRETKQIRVVQINMPSTATEVIDVTPEPIAIEGKGVVDGECRDGDPGHERLALREADAELLPGGVPEAV